MKHMVSACLSLSALLFAPWSSQAGDDPASHHREMLIALHTDALDLHETVVSHLALGDVETVVTDSGRTIDLLRTEDGVEIYIDGELLDLGGLHGWALHDERHRIHQRWEVICDDDEACDEEIIVDPHGGFGADLPRHPGHAERVVVISKAADSD